MAKSTKKNSKQSKTKTKKEEIHRVAPEIPPGLISLAMSRPDMETFANLMSIAARTFERLAMQAAQENDEAAFQMLQARQRLSHLFAEKLVEACRMPEPESRDMH